MERLSRSSILLVIIVIAILSVAYLAASMTYQPDEPGIPNTGGTASDSYTSALYGYSFSYPAEDSVRERSPSDVVISAPDGTLLVELTVAIGAPKSGENFATYAQRLGKEACASMCAEPSRSYSYLSQTGVIGQESYFFRAADGSSESGPYFVFELNPSYANGRIESLAIYPPAGVSSDMSAQVLNTIALTLRIADVWQ